MRTQIRGLDRASLNIQDGVSLLQIGDGALQKLTDLMQRMRELSVQSANDTNELLDREAIQLEFGQLTSEINDIVSKTNFNERKLFDGSIGASFDYYLGKMVAAYEATINSAIGASDTVSVPGWTVPTTPSPPTATTFGVISVQPGLDTADFSTNTSGLYAMQIVTPADGTLNVILDYSQKSISNYLEFLDYFKTEFNALSNSLGLGDILENIRYENRGADGDFIVFDFPTATVNGQTTLTGIMGKPIEEPVPTGTGALPRVLIGIGAGTTAVAGQQRDSLIGQPGGGWLRGAIHTRSNRPDDTVPINSSDFENRPVHPAKESPRGTALHPAASPPTGGFSHVTLTVGTNAPIRIDIVPGSYLTIQDFIDANREAFLNAGFDLETGEDGGLIITGRLFGGDTPPTVTVAAHPTAMLGLPSSAVVERAPSDSLWIQSGANEGDGIGIEIPNLSARSLGLAIRRPADESGDHINSLGADGYTAVANVTGDPMEYSLDVTSHEKASAALSVLTNAINIVSLERGRIGAQQNRLEFSMANVDNTSENMRAAESRIRDADMAKEMTHFVKNQILQQSGTAMLAQANTLPQGMLQLLG